MSSNYVDVYGYQLTMSFDGINVTSVEAGKLAMGAGNVGMSGKSMTMSYHNVAGNAVSATANEVLFTLEVTATKAGKLSEMMSANSSIARAEAYYGEALAVANVELGLRTDGEVELVAGYELYQNEPNPFNGVTQVGFRLPTANLATVTVYDVTGKVIKRTTNDYEKGYNVVELNRSDLGAAARVLYYQLESGNFTETKKMIVIE